METWYDNLPAEQAYLAWHRLQTILFERLEKQPFLQFFQIYLNLTKSYYETKHKNLGDFTSQFTWLLNAALTHPHYTTSPSFSKLILDGLNLLQNTNEMYFYSLFAHPDSKLDGHPFFQKLRTLAPKPIFSILESALDLALLRCDPVGLAWSDSIIFQLTNIRQIDSTQVKMIRRYVLFHLQMGWTKEELKEQIDYFCPDPVSAQKYHRVLKEQFTIPPKADTKLKGKMFEKVVMSFL
jgi:hypothetical protein